MTKTIYDIVSNSHQNGHCGIKTCHIWYSTNLFRASHDVHGSNSGIGVSSPSL